MANAAAEPASPPGLVRLLFEPSPGRTEFALRLALICAASTVVGEIYQKPPDLAVAVYIPFFLNRSDRTTGVVLGLAASIFISLCLALVLGGERLVIDHPPWKVAFIAAVSFTFLFIGSASKLAAVGGIISLIVGYALDVTTQLPVNELASHGIVYGWLLIGMPAAVSVIINLVMAPSPRQIVQRDLAAGLRLAARLLVRPDRATRTAAREALRSSYEETLGRLKLVKVEHTTPGPDIEALRQAALSTTTILTLANLADRDPSARPSDAACASLASTLGEMAGVLADGAYPVEIEAPELDVASLSPRAAAVVTQMRLHIGGFAVPPPATSTPANANAKQKSSFFKPDALTNPAYVRHALKTTAAAMTCYALYTTLEWSSIHTCFITCYIVSLTTVADSVQKLALRLAGCFVGAAAGIGAIIYVIPHFTSIPELFAVVFLGAFVAAWIAGGSPRISYAGFQLGFAFFLCVIQGYKPGTEMYVARDRVFGILIGNAVSYLFLTTLWPVSIGQRIADGMVAALRQLRDLAGATSRHDGATAAARVHAALAGVENDLALARLEPAALRPAPEWIDNHERAAEEIVDLAEILVVGAGADTHEDGAPSRETVEEDLRRLESELDVQRSGAPNALLTHG